MPKIVRSTSAEPPMMNFFRASEPRRPPPRRFAMGGKLSFSGRPLGSAAADPARQSLREPNGRQNQQREDRGGEAEESDRAVHDRGGRRDGIGGRALQRRADAEPAGALGRSSRRNGQANGRK